MPVAVDEMKLSELIEKAVHKSVEEEFDRRFAELMLRLVPYVSDEEQKEIEEMFGKEPGKDDIAYSELIEI